MSGRIRLGFILRKDFERTVAFWKYWILGSGSCAIRRPPCIFSNRNVLLRSVWNTRVAPCTPGASCGSPVWLLWESTAEGYRGRDDSRRGKAATTDGFRCQNREIELIPPFLWERADRRRDNVSSELLSRWSFAFCANYGFSSRRVLLYLGVLSWSNRASWGKIHGLLRTLIGEGVKSWPGVGCCFALFDSKELRSKTLNLSWRCHRAGVAITIFKS